MPIANANGKKFTFPEGTTPEQMGAAIDEFFLGQSGEAESYEPPQAQAIEAPKNDSWQITKGFKAGVDQVQALGGGLTAAFGDALGVDSLKEWGLESYERNMAEAQENQGNVQGFTDIEGFGDAVDWALYTAGNMTPMLATSIAGGGAGGLLAANLAKGAAQKIIAAEVAKGVAKKKAAEIAAKHIAKSAAIGAGAGTFASSAGMETGSIYGDIQDLPGDNKAGVAFAHGAVAGALESLLPFNLLDKFGVGKAAKDEITESVMKFAGKQMMTEGMTEGMQTIVEQHARYWLDENEGMFEPHHWKEIVDASAAGALMGGVAGGASGYMNKGKQPAPPTDEERVNAAKEAVAEQGGDALAQTIAGSEELAKPSPLESFGSNDAQKAEIEAIRQRRMDRLMNARGNLDPEYFVRDKGLAPDPSQPVDFESTPLPEATPQGLLQPVQPNGSEIEFEGRGLELEPLPTQTPTYENAIDFERSKPVPFSPTRTDELAKNIELQDRANSPLPLLDAPDRIQISDDRIAGNANTGLDQMPENVGRMDSDPIQRNKERALGYDVEAKKRTKAERQARLPEGLNDERWLREATAERPAYAQAVYDLADNVIKGGGISYVTNEHSVINGRTKSLNPEWAQSLLADEGVSTGYLKITAAKAMKGGKLTEKQARVITRMMDVVEATYNDPQNIEFVKQERVKKNQLRRAIRDNAAILDRLNDTNENIPQPEYIEIESQEFDPRHNLSQDEQIEAEALMDAMQAGIPESVTDELALRYDAGAFASQVQRAIRDKNNEQRQGNFDGQSETTTANKGNQSRSQAALSEEAGRNAEAQNAQVERPGQADRAGRETGLTSEQADAELDRILATEAADGLTVYDRELAKTIESLADKNDLGIRRAMREVQAELTRDGEGETLSPALKSYLLAKSNDTKSNGQLEDNSEPLLTSYTEAEILEREAEKKAAAESEAQATKQAEQKEAADKAVDSFDLTGSDRQADANPNQNDIFDSASGEKITPTGNRVGDTENYEFPDGSIQSRADDEIQSDQASVTKPAENESTGQVKDKDTFTFGDNTFNRGDYAKAIKSQARGTKTFFESGEIEGISHAKKEVKIKGVWHDFGSIVKADRPLEITKKTKPLSEVVASAGKEPEGGFTDADKVPDTTPKTYVEQYDDLWDRVNKNDKTLTLKEIIDYVKSLQANEEAVKANLNKLTKAKLGNYYNGYQFSDMKKDQLVRAVYKDLAGQFGFLTTNKDMMVIGGTGMKDRIAHTIDQLEAMTDEQFRENLDARKEKRDKRQAEYDKTMGGIKDPKTLEDFQNAKQMGLSKNFTAEQWATYDRLHADDRLEKQAANRVKTVESVDGEVNYTLHETKHTQKGHDLFIVSLSDRVGSELYRELATKSKQLGGYYSKYSRDGAIPGFQFRTEEARADFLKVLEGDSVEKTKQYTDKTETLMELAERMEDRATDSLNQDRKTNTHKRSTEAGYAIEKAENELGEAADIRALAEAINKGEAKYLSKLSARTEIEALRGEWNKLIWQARQTEEGKALTQDKKDRSGYEWKKGVTPEQKVRFAEYPLMRVRADTVSSIANDMIKTKGFKLAGQVFAKLAKNNEGKIYVAGNRHFDKFKEFAIKNLQYSYMTDVAKDFNRMQKLGIETLPMLRATLLEFNELTSGATKKEVKSATSEKLKYSSFMGKYKENDFFNTTNAPADQVIELADIEEGMSVFEPSAGLGHLADKAAEVVGKDNVTTNELSFEMDKFLKDNGYNGTHGDFLELEADAKYDRVIMNPPFSKDQEITHIEHAYKFLKPGGRLVAITSSMAGERSNKRNKAFTEWLDELGADQYPLPEGSFKDAINPTGVNTKIIVIDKPSDAALFSKSSTLKEGATPKGLGVKHAENIAKAFLKTYKGAEDGLKVRVYASQAVAFGPDSRKRHGRVKGGYLPETNELILIAPHLDNTQDAIETLQHEIIVHKGLGLFEPAVQDQIIDAVLSAAQTNRALSSVWATVQKDYADKSKRIQAEEVLAKVAETRLSKFDQAFNKFVIILRKALRKIGLIKNNQMGKRDMLDLIYAMGDGFKQGRKAGQRSDQSLRYQSAFHGTPHKFDKFSLDAMGTGEGAQAYGWGMYFAGKKEVAEYYKKQLSDEVPMINGKRASEHAIFDTNEWATTHWKNLWASYIQDGDLDAAKADAIADLKYRMRREDSDSDIRQIKEVIEFLGSVQSIEYEYTGNLYQVDIPENHELLDWDKPLSEQSESVIKALEQQFSLESFNKDFSTAGEFYKSRVRRHGGNQQKASDELNALGIKGLRYLDGTSRSKGEGHHNYVIWDEDAITVEAVNDEQKKADEQILFSRSRDTDTDLDEEALSKLGLGKKATVTLRDKIRDWKDYNFKAAADRAYEGMFDGLHGLKKAEDSVGVTDNAESGYVGARLASGVADTMHAVLHYGAPVWRDGILQHKEGTQGLLEIFGELGGELNGWLAWMGAKRGEELIAQGRENNLTQQDINALKAQAFGREDLFEEVRQKYIALNKAMLDMSEEAGLIKPGSRQQWESDYYVPFYRQADMDNPDSPLLAPRTKRGLSHQAAGIKALKGGDTATNDLLENILQNWIKLTDASMKNSALLKATENLKDTEYLTDESMKYTKAIVSKSEINKRIKSDRQYREMVAEYLGLGRDANTNKVLDKAAKLDAEGFESMWAITEPTDPDIIRVQKEGKNHYYRVNDPSLLRAMVHLGDTGSNNMLMRGGRYMKSLLTMGVTSSPDFILRNFIRDAVHAWAINPDEFTFGKDSFSGLKHAVKEDDDYRALMFSGASFQGGYVHGTDPERSGQIVRRALEKKGLNSMEADGYMDSLLRTPHHTKNALMKGWQTYRNFGDKVENSNRLATFKAAIEAGKPMAQAVYESKDLMDYSLRGNFGLMMGLTDLVPFLNARMQGLSKLGRAAKENPSKVIKSAGVKIALFSMALAALNDDDERYQELPDWDKDANWHFWVGEDHWRIPKPFEIGIVFGTMPERLYHTMAGNQDNEKLMWSIQHNLLHTLNINPIPQAVMPIAEVVANRSFFFDTPIEGMSDEGKLDEARYNERTSSTMKELGALGKWVGLSPKELQHLYNGYLGTMGSYGLMLADMVTNAATGRSDRPEWRPEDYPVVKSFYKGAGPAKSTQYLTDVYDRMNEAEQIWRTIRSYRQEGRTEDADELLENNRDKVRYRKALGLARQQLGSINKQMTRISRDEDMSAGMKRLKMDKLSARKNKIAKRFAELTDEAF